MAKRPQKGDIYEILTCEGSAYFQYVFKNEDTKLNLVRVLPGIFDVAPTSFTKLAKSKELFYVYFPLGAANSRGIVTLVANEPIPAWVQVPPVMRSRLAINREGKVLSWRISYPDGMKTVNEMSDEEKRLSIDQIVNDTMLIEMICSGWRPEKCV